MVLKLIAAAALVGNCGKPSRVFQAAEEIIKKNVGRRPPYSISSTAAVSTSVPFHSSFFLVLFLSLFRHALAKK